MHLFLSHNEEHANTAFYTIVLWSQQTIQESAGGGLSSSVTAAGSGLVLGLGCFDSCGCCGWLVSGSTSTSPRHVSTARFDPWSEELGACPRPTFFHRRFYPGLRVGWLLRLLSKLPCDGVPPDLRWPWSLLHRRRPATDRRRRSLEASGSRGFHMVQGLFCNLCFSQGPLCKLVGQLSLYPPAYLYSYVYLYIFHNQ